MITMTPEVLRTYSHAINMMDPNHAKVTEERAARGAYCRSPALSWFEENAHEYTANQLAGMLNMLPASVREKASRLGIKLVKSSVNNYTNRYQL